MRQATGSVGDLRQDITHRLAKFITDPQVDIRVVDSLEKLRQMLSELEAIGDIIRTTPILHRLRLLYPDSKIYWLTNYPEVLPEEVDYKLKYNFLID